MSDIKVRPKVLTGKTYKIETGCGSLYVTVNSDKDGKIVEVFAVRGKQGGCSAAFVEGICRVVSKGLRSGGITANDVIDSLAHIRCSSPKMSIDGAVTSCPDAIARCLREATGKGILLEVVQDGKEGGAKGEEGR
jgi:ribonucleoside-diphosphate reductase alpha chain